VRKIIVPTLVLYTLWLLLSGYYIGLILSLGAASCLVVATLANRLGVLEPDGRSFAFVWRLILYVPWLIKEIVLSNIEVAKLIWHPRLPITPQVIRAKASQRTPLGLAAFANSITLTPGTLSLDADEDGFIVVHAIGDATAEGLQTGEMDRRVAALEDNQ
jgi:multicomponent Na+:H+ antiporter subunit E